MNIENIVTDFVDDFNSGNVERLLQRMTDDFVQFDTFFSDVVPYRNYAEYHEHDIAGPRIRYSVVNLTECNPTSARYEYRARIFDTSDKEVASYTGVEKLSLRFGKISRATDCYIAPPEMLEIYYGQGSENFYSELLQCRSDFFQKLRTSNLYALPNLSISVIAEKIGHTEELIATLFENGFRCSVDEFIDRYRVERARELIGYQALFESPSSDMDMNHRVAAKVGFSSHASFVAVFEMVFRQTPCEFRQCRRNMQVD